MGNIEYENDDEKLFVNQAAHLLLAFAGIKPLPKPKYNPAESDSNALPFSEDELLPPCA